MILTNIYHSLLSCDKRFFSCLSEEEFRVCNKIADDFLGQKTNIESGDLSVIQARIAQFKEKKWTPEQTARKEEVIDELYTKFHPEGITIAALPADLLRFSILPKVAEFQLSQVCRSWATLSIVDQVWREIAKKIECSTLEAVPGKLYIEIKKYCRKYAKEISGLPDVNPEIKKLLEGQMTIEKMLRLKEWRKDYHRIVQQRGRVAPLDGVIYAGMFKEGRLSSLSIKHP
jgi:hypothetical protein